MRMAGGERHVDKDHDADLFGRAVEQVVETTASSRTSTSKSFHGSSEVADAGVSFAWSDLTESKFTSC